MGKVLTFWNVRCKYRNNNIKLTVYCTVHITVYISMYCENRKSTIFIVDFLSDAVKG